MSRFLTILEVSQKQAYIFSSNKVKDNIVNSAIISKVLSPDYFTTIQDLKYEETSNLVYSGGGHTILEFKSKEEAKDFVSILTLHIYKNYAGLEVFAKTVEYDETESPKNNLKNLSKHLERKKAVRQATFHQGSFGVEVIDSETRKTKALDTSEYRQLVQDEEYGETTRLFTPKNFRPAYKFEDLSGKSGVASKIAVIHIDGNGMGKRVDELYDIIGDTDWKNVKIKLRAFSEGIESDFKSAYHEMTELVGDSILSGSLKNEFVLNTDKESDTHNEKQYFPIRRIITAGDDICFVTNGAIGLECARIFIEKLSTKKNVVDGKGYFACAGVAIVHCKYPFYKAYELAEMLCSSAKKHGAILSPNDMGRSLSLIDWHIEYGELKDSLDEIRKNYICHDGNHMSLKPYTVVSGNVQNTNEYRLFVERISKLQSEGKKIGKGKIKNLRAAFKEGILETDNYIRFNRMEDFIDEPFIEDITSGKDSNIKACKWFDAVEMMDVFTKITEGGIK